uniref:Insulin-like domain-containing protein n=1 Tax=Romanomermis culicivorax TaxID=13658 RepID=A0A915I7J8_ROMCU
MKYNIGYKELIQLLYGNTQNSFHRIDISSDPRVQRCLFPYNIRPLGAKEGPLVRSLVMVGFLACTGVAPPMTNVGVGVTTSSWAQQTWPCLEPVDWMKHQSYNTTSLIPRSNSDACGYNMLFAVFELEFQRYKIEMMLVKVVISVVIVLWISEGNSCAPAISEAKTRSCGRRLLKQVLRICNNCIAGSHIEEVKKRDEHYYDDQTLDAFHSYFPWLKTYRSKRGIVEECCQNQCSFRTLKKYCCKSTKSLRKRDFFETVHQDTSNSDYDTYF